MATLATSLSEQFIALPPGYYLERAASEALTQAARLQLDSEVVEASADVRSEPHDLLAAIEAGTLRLPHDPLWMEWPGVRPAHLDATKASLLPMDAPGSSTDRIGVLVRANGEGRWMVNVGVRTFGNVAEWFPMAALIEGQTTTLVTNPCTAFAGWAEPDINRLLGRFSRTVRHAVTGTLYIVALLTARNAPLTVGQPADDYLRLNRQRAKRGKPPVLGCRPVRWDLWRDVHRSGSRALGEADRQRAIAHIVRGHFKVRKSGIYWWRPHLRNVVPGEDLPQGRDYRVAA